MRRRGSRAGAGFAAGGVALLLAAAVVAVLLAGPGGHRPRERTTTSVSTTTTSVTATSTTVSATPTTPTVPIPAQRPARPAPAGDAIGASVNLLFNGSTVSPGEISAQLTALRATGATIARSDALWEASEPAAPVGGVHHYVWTFDDTIAGALAVAHLRWLPILDYTAPWAESIPGTDHSAPTSAADFAAYAGAFAARYGPGGAFWRTHPELRGEPVQTYEIWNEPDGGFFWLPGPEPAQYSDLYLTARATIDAAQPDARVLIGGLTRPTGFVPEMLAAQPALRGHIDGIAIHPYGTPPIVVLKITQTRAALNALGLGSVPLYVTEVGWSTSPPGTNDYVAAAQRPAYIEQTLAALGHLNCGVAATVLYTWSSPQQNPADGEQWYGIDSVSAAPTADTRAFAAGVRAAQAHRAARHLCR
jgi:hypothetical protein